MSLLNDSFPVFRPTACDLVPGSWWHRIRRIFILSVLDSQHRPSHTTNSSSTHYARLMWLATYFLLSLEVWFSAARNCSLTIPVIGDSLRAVNRLLSIRELTLLGQFQEVGEGGGGQQTHSNVRELLVMPNMKESQTVLRWKSELGRGRTSKSFKNSPTQ